MVNEARVKYAVDPAIPQVGGWPPVTLGERSGPAARLRFPADTEADVCVRERQARLRHTTGEPSDKMEQR
jgi:hypothetical protein